jgi:hypothetical protein
VASRGRRPRIWNSKTRRGNKQQSPRRRRNSKHNSIGSRAFGTRRASGSRRGVSRRARSRHLPFAVSADKNDAPSASCITREQRACVTAAVTLQHKGAGTRTIPAPTAQQSCGSKETSHRGRDVIPTPFIKRGAGDRLKCPNRACTYVRAVGGGRSDVYSAFGSACAR